MTKRSQWVSLRDGLYARLLGPNGDRYVETIEPEDLFPIKIASFRADAPTDGRDQVLLYNSELNTHYYFHWPSWKVGLLRMLAACEEMLLELDVAEKAK